MPIIVYPLIFGGSFTLAWTFLLLLRPWAIRNRYLAVPNNRTSHKKSIPNIGGLSFYLSLPVVLGFSLYTIETGSRTGLVIISFLVFLILGMWDDKHRTRALIKLLFQTAAVVIFILGSGWKLTDFFGIFQMSPLFSFIYTLLFSLVLINAVNMLDGIDGLAGLLGMIVFLLLGLFFLVNDVRNLTVFSFSMSGILLAFLRSNFSKRKKMLMGDTGSLWIGFALALLIVRAYNEPGSAVNVSNIIDESYWNRFVILFLISVPLFDFFRVFFMRIFRGRSPFTADRNHVHHLLVDRYQMAHWKASFVIVLINLSIFLIALILAPWFTGIHFLIAFLVFFLLYCYVVYSMGLSRHHARTPVKQAHNA